jgi:TrmH family RNA methyltransferase
MLIEGYREILRAVTNAHPIEELFFCPALFQGSNEAALLEQCRAAGANLFECTEAVFRKMAYRDRPEGLLALAPKIGTRLDELRVPADALVVVAESIEKPGNLGTILRTADGAAAAAVIVCDRCTDICNPNVVRASIGTLFCIPVAQASKEETAEWLEHAGLRVCATTPHADIIYYEADLRSGTAIVLGTEQYGLSAFWLQKADLHVRIPMRGQADSLNVAAAATILLYEALRQRSR